MYLGKLLINQVQSTNEIGDKILIRKEKIRSCREKNTKQVAFYFFGLGSFPNGKKISNVKKRLFNLKKVDVKFKKNLIAKF